MDGDDITYLCHLREHEYPMPGLPELWQQRWRDYIGWSVNVVDWLVVN